MTTENLDGGQEPRRMDGWNLANYLDLFREFIRSQAGIQDDFRNHQAI